MPHLRLLSAPPPGPLDLEELSMISSSQEGKYVWLGFWGWTWQRHSSAPPHPFRPPPTEFQAPAPWAAPPSPSPSGFWGGPWIQLCPSGPPGVSGPLACPPTKQLCPSQAPPGQGPPICSPAPEKPPPCVPPRAQAQPQQSLPHSRTRAQGARAGLGVSMAAPPPPSVLAVQPPCPTHPFSLFLPRESPEADSGVRTHPPRRCS